MATNPESPERAMEKTMTSFACDYDRRSAPASRMWYYVSTPSVFCEHNLPVSDERMSRAEKRKYRELLDLSERHGAPIRASHYRIG